MIDAEARNGIVRHIDAMRTAGRRVDQLELNGECRHGTFVPPTIIEIGHISELKREIFGPVLHVVRYKREELDALLEAVNGTGYGLTFGVHTRIDETIAHVTGQVHAGNVYVNRNIVGAVVGVQPFGGECLSGTGPAPAARCTCTVCWARARRPAAGAGSGRAAAAAHRAARSHGRDQHLSGRAARRRALRGGQRGRRARAMGGGPADRQPCLVRRYAGRPGAAVRAGCRAAGQAGILADADVDHADFQAVLFEGMATLRALNQRIAQRAGPILAVHGLTSDALRARPMRRSACSPSVPSASTRPPPAATPA